MAKSEDGRLIVLFLGLRLPGLAMDWLLCLTLVCWRYDGPMVTVWDKPYPPRPPYSVGIIPQFKKPPVKLRVSVQTIIRYETIQTIPRRNLDAQKRNETD